MWNVWLFVPPPQLTEHPAAPSVQFSTQFSGAVYCNVLAKTAPKQQGTTLLRLNMTLLIRAELALREREQEKKTLPQKKFKRILANHSLPVVTSQHNCIERFRPFTKHY